MNVQGGHTEAGGVGIDAQLNAQLTDDQKHHRELFMKLLHAIQFLLC